MEDSGKSSSIQLYNDEGSQSRDLPKTLYEQVIMLLSEATLSIDPSTRIELISSVKDIVLNKEPALLDTFLPEILQFQNDRNVEVRKFVVVFIEEAIKKDCDVMPNLIQNVQSLLQDRAPAVQKRVVQCIRELYKTTLLWLSRAPTVTGEMQRVWSSMANMKGFVINMVDCENDGLRGQIIKFMEKLILLQTYPEPDSLKRDNEFSLEDIPLTLKVARRRKLEEEAMTVFDLMIKFYGSSHISSGNMMTCMGSLTTIAKLRPSFMGKVITALETLHMNLPPSLSTTQVNSVRKHLKMQLLGLLKHPAAVDYVTNITTLLTDLGATTSEVNKAFPKFDELKKRSRKAPSDSAPPAKKTRFDEASSIPDSAIDITETFVLERLSPELAAQLVIVGMNRLPETMPPIFSATYTPIAAAGTQGQIKHLSRLLATQLTAAGLGPGASIASTQISKPLRLADDDDDDEFASSTVASAGVEEDEAVKGGTAPSKNLKLEVSKPLNSELRDNLQSQAIARILRAQESAITGGVSGIRLKIISSVASSFNIKLRQEILRYVLSDIRNQLNLALSWVYEEFSYMQGFSKRPPTQTGDNKSYDNHYDQLVCTLVNSVINNRELKDRETILTRLYLEMPIITEESTEILKKFSSTEVLGLNIVNKMIQIKPPKQMIFLKVLLECTSHQTAEIRETAISHVVDLYPREEMQKAIEDHGLYYLSFLKLPVPPSELFGPLQGRSQRQETWSDECTKACLYLFLSLLPINQELIHELAGVYIQTAHADVKRAILRVVEHPVKAMGMDSPELLKLVQECPKGSETLVTRLIQILTDKSAPSPELVAIVRELYQTRVSDVRFLIPVLNGLTKNEVIAALPKLIKLNPIVVKEVFNRLLCTSNDGSNYTSPVTPADLLIALHTVDTTKCELKTVIKATSLCFNDKQAYTQEVLAVVMQHLMEITPLPTLLMRTVIQALSLYPRLIGFVMNILQRLILKQVWKQKKVWEGFIKCCQRAQPHSFQVLLQLPSQQLEDVFKEAPDLKKPLLDHIMEFTENQRAHIPQSVMDILLGPANPMENNNFAIKEEPLSPPHDLMIDIKEEIPDDVPMRVYSQPAPPGLE